MQGLKGGYPIPEIRKFGSFYTSNPDVRKIHSGWNCSTRNPEIDISSNSPKFDNDLSNPSVVKPNDSLIIKINPLSLTTQEVMII